MSTDYKTNRKKIIYKALVLTITATIITAVIIVLKIQKSESIHPLEIPKPKNIVVINIDSLRADRMGIYGYSKDTTPFLDSLMKKGAIFENAETPAYLTFQSDAALFSGLYPSENNVIQWTTPINKSLTLLPSILTNYGYNTAGFVSPSLWPRFGWSTSFQYYKMSENTKNVAFSKTDVSEYLKKGNSTFIFWHIYDAHSPYMSASSSYNSVFDDSKMEHSFIWEAQSTSSIPMHTSEKRDATTLHQFTDDDKKYLNEAYDRGVQYVDEELRTFFESIKNEPWYKDTMFIISSEHGDDLGEHGYFFHRDLYEVNTHVPLAIIYPPYIKPMRIATPVNTMDLMPTLVAIAQGIPPEHTSGTNIIPLINGEVLSRDIFTERPPFDEYAVRRGNWKYIMRNPAIKDGLNTYDYWMKRLITHEPINTKDELYNLTNDPNEQNNLIGTGLSIESELQSTLFGFRADMRKARELNKNIPNITPQGGSLIPYP
ncbi:MAG: sulfatase-like hydrolase/transferase [bacterium]